VLPGHPDEMKAMFESIAEEFDGQTVSETLYTVEPEAHIIDALQDVQDQFAVSVGCYPDKEHGRNRLKITGTDSQTVREAATGLSERIDASETPVERDW
jgi:molybdopterin-biosynthesis enzyme MoeA-like protein